MKRSEQQLRSGRNRNAVARVARNGLEARRGRVVLFRVGYTFYCVPTAAAPEQNYLNGCVR